MMHDVENSLDQFKIGNSYETVEFIGYNGSTGVIYKGRNINLDTPVAIKILNPELCKNDQFMVFLNSELKSVFRLNHPNIVNVKETGKENDKFYIIMEYIDGENLEQILKEKKTLPYQEAVELLQQLALALDYAHSNNVIHKALKPRNIMLTKDNQVKLTGFGLAKALSTAWLTVTATSAENLEYLSPEQAEGEDIDHRCDIYSFGVIAYHILTGEVPFKKEGSSILNLAMKHINEPPEPLRRKNQAVPQWLDNVVMKCLEKKPLGRFQSGKEIYEALANKYSLHTPLPQSVTAEELKGTLSNKVEIEDVLQDYFNKEVSFQKEKQSAGALDSQNKSDQTNSFNIKNQKQLKLLLFVVILLELVIISIFVYILFNG
jgi:serine/threonine protein kinase